LTELLRNCAAYPERMDDVYANRRRNFLALLNASPLGSLPRKKDQAIALDVSASMFSQLLNPSYRIGDAMARNIEEKLSMEPGSLDRGTLSQPTRTDPERMADAMRLLDYLGELQDAPGLSRDPVALCIAYDFLESMGTPAEGNVIDITKRLAKRLKEGDA
jgi:hypothetical protein